VSIVPLNATSSTAFTNPERLVFFFFFAVADDKQGDRA
jgi:hypothetical protein